ncbi:MAG: hypothetical protein NWQ38_03085 [Cellulophaga sp.]|nr:hypothetical protein [Cellulophaga sp.]
MKNKATIDNKNLKVLLVDETSAHTAYVKTYYSKKESKNIVFLSFFNCNSLRNLVNNQEVKLAIIFIYDIRGLQKLIPFLELGIKTVICGHERYSWWLKDSLHQLDIIDLSMPKKELFDKLDAIIKEHWVLNETNS